MQARGDRACRRGVMLQHLRQDRLVGNQGGVRQIKQRSGHDLGRRCEGVQGIDALGDLRDAAIAMRSMPAIQRGLVRRPRTTRATSSRTCAPSAPLGGWYRGDRAQASVPRERLRPRTRRRNRRRRRRRAGRARGRPADAPAHRRQQCVEMRRMPSRLRLPKAGSHLLDRPRPTRARSASCVQRGSRRRRRRSCRAHRRRRARGRPPGGARPRAGFRHRPRRARRPRARPRRTARSGLEDVAEQAGDAQRHVDAGPVEHGERQELDAGDAVRSEVPDSAARRGRRAPAQGRRRRCASRRRPTGRARARAASRRGPADSGAPPRPPRARRSRSRAGRDGARIDAVRLRPVGSTSARPRLGAPAGPAATRRPSSAASRASRSLVHTPGGAFDRRLAEPPR